MNFRLPFNWLVLMLVSVVSVFPAEAQEMPFQHNSLQFPYLDAGGNGRVLMHSFSAFKQSLRNWLINLF